MNDSMYSPIAVPSSGNPVQVDVVSVAQQGPLGPVGPVGPEGPKGDPGNYPEAPNDAYVYGRGGNPVVNWMRALPLAGGSLTGTLSGTTAVFDTINAGTLNATALATFSNGLSVTGGSLGAPNGTSAAPGLAIGALDGTGLMRSGTAMVFGIQNAPNLAMFAGGTSQFYGPLAMLNNKITGLADATAAQDALNQRSGDARYLNIAGGTLSGPLTLSANAASALQPVTLQQMNAATGAYLPLSGGTVTGATTISTATAPPFTVTAGAGTNPITITPGAGAANGAIIRSGSTTGSIIIAPTQTSTGATVVNIGGSGSDPFGPVAVATPQSGGNTGTPSTGNLFNVPNRLQAQFFATPQNTYSSGYTIGNFSANYTGTFVASGTNALVAMVISSDTAHGAIPTLNVTRNFGGAGTFGSRNHCLFQLSTTGTVVGDTSSQQYVSTCHWLQMAHNVGGTGPGGNSRGFAYGMNPQVVLLGGASNQASYYALANALGEVDIATQGTQQTCTIGGTITAGDVVSLTFTSTGITGSPITVNYTVATGNTVGWVGKALQAAIWNNVNLVAAGVSARLVDSAPAQMQLFWPITLPTVTVTSAVSGAATETVTLGSVVPGASADTKYGMSIVRLAQDTASPMTYSAAIWIADQLTTPAAGWQNILGIGGGIAQWPLDPQGTLIQARPQYAAGGSNLFQPLPANLAAGGIDFTKVNFSTASLQMPGMSLDGTGKLFLKGPSLTTDNTGLRIDATGWVGTGNAAVAAGGGGGSGSTVNNYWVGDLVFDDLGGQHQVTAVNNSTGAVTAVTTLVQPSVSSGGSPANTRTATGGSGAGLTLNVTWTATTALLLNPSGGNVTAPTVAAGDSSTSVATTAWVRSFTGTGAYLPLAGGTVTGATTFGSTLGVTGAATLSGNLTLNAAGGTPALHVSGPTATFRTIRFETAGQARLSMALDNSAETGTTGSGVGSNFILSTFDNTGVALASPLLTINRATPFTLTYAGRIVQNVPTIAGAVTNQGYFSQATITGSDNTAAINALNTWAINSDTQARTGNLGFSNAILYNFGGTGFSGGRGGLFVSMMQTGASTSTGFIEGIQSSVNLYHSLGGSNTAYNAQGSATCFNPYMFLGSGATNLQGWSGAEFDFNVNASATYQTGVGILIVHTPGHAGVGAFQSDAAIQLADGSAVTAGWDYGIMFGSTNGRYPIKSTGTMLYARPSRNVGVTLNAAAGIDFSACTFSGSALKLPNGFAVDGSGNAQIGTGYINQTAGGISVDVSGSVVTAAAIVSGGSGWPTDGNQYFATDANGGVYAIGNTGGVANSIVILQPSFAKGTPPANPVTLTPDGVAAGLGATSITVNLTWSARTALALNPSGGAVRLGSGCFTANGTTSVSLTALAPAAAHATVQEWLTITDAGGTVRYIPCF